MEDTNTIEWCVSRRSITKLINGQIILKIELVLTYLIQHSTLS